MLGDQPRALGENSSASGHYRSERVSRPLLHTSCNSSRGWDGRGFRLQTRKRQGRIISVGPVPFLIVVEARGEKRRGDGSARPVSDTDVPRGTRSSSGLCQRFSRKIVAIENP